MRGRVVMLVAAGLLAACDIGSAGPDPAAATLRLVVDPCDAVARRQATAVLIGEQLAATVAHPFLDDLGEVAFASFQALEAAGDELDARLVYVDPERDLALLIVDTQLAPLRLADHDDDTSVRVLSYDATEKPGTPPRSQAATLVSSGPVSFDGQGQRAALELAIAVEPGDSGAPVLDDDNQVIGVVFATDRNEKRSWAIAASEFEEAMAQLGKGVDVEGCD